MKVKYFATANFDIETEINVDSDKPFDVWCAIMNDLENRYRLSVDYTINDKDEADDDGTKRNMQDLRQPIS